MCGIIFANFPMTFDERFKIIDHRGTHSTWWKESGFSCYHRRLATFAPDFVADHPVTDCKGRFAVVMNGNIYNYRELKQIYLKDHRFDCENSDTEVVAHLYERFGVKIFDNKMLDGDYAIIIYDRKKNKTIVAVDYLSLVPLYYMKEDRGIIFASEYKVFWKRYPVGRTFAYDHDVGMYGSPSCHLTPFKNVFKFPEGSYAIVNGNNISFTRYYAPTYERRYLEPAWLWELLCKSVKLKMSSCLPVIIPISGGIDSTAIVAAARDQFSDAKIRTFNVEFEGYSEADSAKDVSNYFGTEHKQFFIKDGQINLDIEKIIFHYESWADRGGLIPEWFVCKSIKEMGEPMTVLKGDCPDELFGGYSRVEGATPIDVFQKATKMKTLTEAEDSFLWTVFRERYPLNNRDGLKALSDQRRPADLFISAEIELPNYGFVKQDRCARAFTLDPRNPWYTKKIVNLAYGLTIDQCFNGKQRKIFLRKALKGKVPDFVIDKPKQPFKLPGWQKINLKKVWNGVFGYGEPSVYDFGNTE